MGVLIYTNIIGSFAFEGSKIKCEVLCKESEILKHNELLAQGKNTPSEDKLLKQYSGASVVGKSGEELPEYIQNSLTEKKYLDLFRTAGLVLVKQQIKDSLLPDHLIIQAVNSMEDIDHAAAGLSKRLREWYGLYNPEFERSIESHEKFSELIQKRTRKELLAEVGTDESKSMGADVEKLDLDAIMKLAKEIESMYALRDTQKDYVEKAMQKLAPNITAVAGGLIGAKLLAVAGSMQKMAILPASTIQLLGAEKALFRHLTTGAKPPKFGVIINHPLVTAAKFKEKGRTARMLADKISIAAKIDFFKGEFRGDDLRKELEKRLAR